MTSHLLNPDSMEGLGGIAVAAIVSVCAKLLLLPSKHSTDFEVHRNWLAITGNLSLKDWYPETGSIWTLDYPPFFAYFEFILAKVADFILPGAQFLKLDAYDNADPKCIYFQRLSVIVSDSLLVYAIFKKWPSTKAPNSKGLLLLLLLPALLIIDHMHFQYNGMMIGLFLLAVKAIHDGQLVIGSALFASLVCFKHLFLVFAPVLGLCLKVLMVAFLPFAFKQQLPLIASRLFPVGRGLMHSYWAPNFWALYATVDVLVRKVFLFRPELHLKLFGHDQIPSSALTNGVVGEKDFAILPNVTSTVCLTIVGLVHLPIAFKLLRNPSQRVLINLLIVSGLVSFLFGYHVHEKAIIPVLALYLYFNEHFSPAAHSKIASILLASQFALLPLMHGWIEAAIGFTMIIAGSLVQAGFASLPPLKFNTKLVVSILPLILAGLAKVFLKELEFAPLFIISSSYAAIICLRSLQLYLHAIRK